MNLKDILAISGYPGLFKMISQAKNGIIVESLIDRKRFPAFASARVNALDDVAIFTETGEIPLKEVLKKIRDKEQGGTAISHKKSTPEQMKSYFSEVMPEYNREKVYVSDIRKVLMWYNTLHEADMLNLPEEETPVNDENENDNINKESERLPETESPKRAKKKSDS